MDKQTRAALRNVRIYDNGGKSYDRYTAVYMDEHYYHEQHPEYRTTFTCIGMSEDPFHPQGFGQHGPAMPGKHLGKRIAFEQLPDPCQRAVLQDLGVNVNA